MDLVVLALVVILMASLAVTYGITRDLVRDAVAEDRRRKLLAAVPIYRGRTYGNQRIRSRGR